MRIIVLGGAGKMGCICVQDLVGDPRVDQVVIADMNIQQAKIVADYLDSPKVELMLIPERLVRELSGEEHAHLGAYDEFIQEISGFDALVNATIRHTNLAVMEACLKAGAHYTDMGGLFFVTQKQLELHQRYHDAGISAVLGMGSAPGVPNVQARYAAERLDSIESIKIYDGIMPPILDDPSFTYSVPTIVDELTMQPMVFRDNKFIARPPLSEFEDYWFTPPIGLLPMHLSLHSEVATLPITFQEKGVKECFFKINYWGMSKEVVERIRVLADFGFGGAEPVEVDGQPVIPRKLMVKLLSGYVPPITDFLKPTFRHPPDWVKEIVTQVHGVKDGKEITYRLGTLTTKGALPTGVAPAIAAIWLAQGHIPPGVYPPEVVIDPLPFFRELETREIVTQVSVTSVI